MTSEAKSDLTQSTKLRVLHQLVLYRLFWGQAQFADSTGLRCTLKRAFVAGVTTLSIMTFGIMTVATKGICVILSI
jgi:hypothetical protein